MEQGGLWGKSLRGKTMEKVDETPPELAEHAKRVFDTVRKAAARPFPERHAAFFEELPLPTLRMLVKSSADQLEINRGQRPEPVDPTTADLVATLVLVALASLADYEDPLDAGGQLREVDFTDSELVWNTQILSMAASLHYFQRLGLWEGLEISENLFGERPFLSEGRPRVGDAQLQQLLGVEAYTEMQRDFERLQQIQPDI